VIYHAGVRLLHGFGSVSERTQSLYYKARVPVLG